MTEITNNKLAEQLNNIQISLNQIKNKLSMNNGLVQIRNSLFWLPNYPRDIIQQRIVDCCDYWDSYALGIIDTYLTDNYVILDIGANIGNHTLYWAKERHAKKIYSFEPVPSTFAILKTNIDINNLHKTVEIYNIGLSNTETKAEISSFSADNIGGTHVSKSNNGALVLKPLDSLKIKEKIDLIKIDVEGAEIDVLKGGIKTIQNNLPIISIESFDKKDEIDEILFPMGYHLEKTIYEGSDYIYTVNK